MIAMSDLDGMRGKRSNDSGWDVDGKDGSDEKQSWRQR